MSDDEQLSEELPDQPHIGGFDYRSFLKSVSQQAGVYQMYDAGKALLYVGKAKNLKKRLSSYFRGSGVPAKTAALVARIHSIEVTVTHTETEALLLEHNLIKQHLPPYNILLRDDKSYPYIFLSDHKYPRLALHRGAKSARGRYFGPYPSATAVRESLLLLQKVFKVRQCEDGFFRNRSRPCLQYQIGRCSGPCVDKIGADEYGDAVRHTSMFLEGKSSDLVRELADRMEEHSSQLNFEDAASCRDQIQYLQQVQASQYIEGEAGDVDIVACVARSGVVCAQVLFVRGGRVLGSRSYLPKVPIELEESEIMETFLVQHYLGDASRGDIPREIIVGTALDDAAPLEQALSQLAGRKIALHTRVRQHRAKWLELASTTAEQNLVSFLSHRQTLLQRFEALQEALQLDAMPQRLECFDISHSHGEATVASCVVFDSNGPLKSDYRRFNIEGITGGDDYAAMHQALQRRYTRIKAGGVQPDILFIDGGKGQVAQALAVLEELQIADVLVIGVAKGVTRKAGLETLWRADTQAEVVLPASHPALHLIQHIRDEAHRFAITGHKQRRDKKRVQSPLESIAGVGAQRRRELLRHFGGLQAIASASVEDLARVPGISEKLAQAIYAALRTA